jgi:hypothetical protein
MGEEKPLVTLDPAKCNPNKPLFCGANNKTPLIIIKIINPITNPFRISIIYKQITNI